MKHLIKSMMVATIAAITLFFTGVAQAKPAFVPAVIYDIGGKNDQSFGNMAWQGMKKFHEETGIEYKEFHVTQEVQREQALRKLAEKSSVVVVTGFAFQTPLANVAPLYPETKFVLIDAVLDLPNVKSILFKEHEGSYLVGQIAAMKSKTGTIGFIGGQECPLIRKFELGYIEGAKSINPNIEVISNMVGTTPSAWNDPTKAAELAKAQIDRRVDVIYAAAGPSGNGAYQAAHDAGIYAIGVDSNQNYIHPGTMLTSMMKRIDVAVYEALKQAASNQFTAGIQTLGLKEEGVDYAYDQYNEVLIDKNIKETLANTKANIINGALIVPDYTQKKK